MPPNVIRLAPPPRSTLFPYTTLFRSLAADEFYARLATNSTFVRVMYRLDMSGQRKVLDFLTGALPNLLDRKSTRLNSSHRTISYAVFRLKKKRLSSLNQSLTNMHTNL